MSIISYYGGTSSFQLLRELSGTSSHGTTMLGLYQAAEKLVFFVEAFEAEDVDHLLMLDHPVILHLLVGGRLQHFGVFYGRKGSKVVLGDPGKGVVFLSNEELLSIWKTRALLSLKPNDVFQKSSELDERKRHWLLNLVRKDFSSLVASLFLGIIVALLGLCNAVFTQKLLDVVLPERSEMKLIIGVVLVAFLSLVRSGLLFIRGSLLTQQAFDFNIRLIGFFFKNLIHLPKGFFDTRRTGDLIARMSDTRKIQVVISFLIGNMVLDLFSLTIFSLFVFVYSWQVGITIVASIPVFGSLLWYFYGTIKSQQHAVMTFYAHSESSYIDTIQGISSIKSMNQERRFEELNNKIYLSFQNEVFRLGNISLRFSAVADILGVFFNVTAFCIASMMVLTGKLRTGEMIAVTAIAGSIIPTILRLLASAVQFQEARVAFDRMYEFFLIPQEKPGGTEGVNDVSELRIENISFGFPGRKPILKDVSFHFRKGELVCLLGESGGGKSTILQLLVKFYQYQNGIILADQYRIEQINTKNWRDLVSIVPQEIKIFNGTLAENLLFDDTSQSTDELIAYCESIGIARFFQKLPQGFFTIVGEEGVHLSGGQKQLVALTRALLRKPKVLLLDEATSAMDRVTENYVMDLLYSLQPSIAIFFVTHKTSIAQRCDRVYILECGSVSIGGTPSELLRFDNLFSQGVNEVTKFDSR